MALRRVPREEMTEQERRWLDDSKALGLDTRWIEFIANAPHVSRFLWEDFYQKLFYNGIVPVHIKELTQLKLSHLHGCAF